MSVSSTGVDVIATPVTVGAVSSSRIVPLAVGSVASCALSDTADSVTVKVSLSSSVVSCFVAIGHVAAVEPTLIVAVLVVVKRSAATAVSLLSIDAVQVTVTAAEAAAVSVSGKAMTAPSVAEAFPTLSVGRVTGVTSRTDNV